MSPRAVVIALGVELDADMMQIRAERRDCRQNDLRKNRGKAKR